MYHQVDAYARLVAVKGNEHRSGLQEDRRAEQTLFKGARNHGATKVGQRRIREKNAEKEKWKQL